MAAAARRRAAGRPSPRRRGSVLEGLLGLLGGLLGLRRLGESDQRVGGGARTGTGTGGGRACSTGCSCGAGSAARRPGGAVRRAGASETGGVVRGGGLLRRRLLLRGRRRIEGGAGLQLPGVQVIIADQGDGHRVGVLPALVADEALQTTAELVGEVGVLLQQGLVVARGDVDGEVRGRQDRALTVLHQGILDLLLEQLVDLAGTTAPPKTRAKPLSRPRWRELSILDSSEEIHGAVAFLPGRVVWTVVLVMRLHVVLLECAVPESAVLPLSAIIRLP